MPELLFIVPRAISGGLRLAGGTVQTAENAADLRAALQSLPAAEPVRAVVVAEHLLARLEIREVRALLARQDPYIIPLPMDWQTTQDARRGLEERVRQLLGFKIPITDQFLRRGSGPAGEAA